MAAIFASVAFLVFAYAITENRVLDIVVGLMAIVMGGAFLVTKAVRVEQVARIRDRMENSESPEAESTDQTGKRTLGDKE